MQFINIIFYKMRKCENVAIFLFCHQNQKHSSQSMDTILPDESKHFIAEVIQYATSKIKNNFVKIQNPSHWQPLRNNLQCNFIIIFSDLHISCLRFHRIYFITKYLAFIFPLFCHLACRNPRLQTSFVTFLENNHLDKL